MTEDRLQSLELKIAFLERANQELSDVLYSHQQELSGLRAQFAALAEQFELLKSQPREYGEGRERPPHY